MSDIQKFEKKLKDSCGLEKIILLNKLAIGYWYITPQKSIDYGMQALRLARELHHLEQEAISLRYIGAGYGIMGKYHKAIGYYSNSLKIETELSNPQGISACLNNMAVNYALMGRKVQALDFHFKALAIFEEIDYKIGLSASLGNIGVIYKDWGNFERASEYLNRALGISREIHDLDTMSEWVNYLGEIELEQQKIEAAADKFDEALEWARKCSNLETEALVLSNIGKVHLKKSDFEKARECFNNTLNVSVKMGKKDGRAKAHTHLAHVLVSMEKHDLALLELEKGLEIAEEIHSLEISRDIYELYSKIYEDTKDYQAALSSYQIYSKLNDQIFNAVTQTRIAELQTKFEASKKEQEAEIFRLKTVELEKLVADRTAELNQSRLELKTERDLFIDGPVVVVRWVRRSGASTQIEYVSPNLEQFGYSAQEFKESRITIKEMIHPDDFNEAYSEMRRHLESEASSWDQEFRLLDRAENVYWIYSLNRFTRDPGEPSRKIYTSYMMNICELKQIQQELQQKQVQLAHSGRLASLGEMATGVAHEINQPLSIIRMQAELMKLIAKSDNMTTQELNKEMDEVILQVDRASDIINHMKGFAHHQIDADSAVDINEFVNRGLIFFREQFRIHDIDFKISLASGLPKLLVNPQHIEQLVVNFLSNARYAVEKQLENASNGFEKRIMLQTARSEDNKWILLIVSDNGIGMTATEKDRCLEPFYTTKEIGKGTGLGLSITNSIIQEFNGELEIDSRRNQGTTFSVKIPVPSSAGSERGQ